MTGPISLTLLPVTHDLGGFSVRRVLPQKARAMVGPFIFVDEFGPAQLDIGRDLGVRPHPHIGLATVTYLFTGAIDHRDSLGTFQTIHPGEVNLMTAGRGIVHSERSPADEMATGARLFGMQTWLALPDHQEDAEPAFEKIGCAQLPTVDDGNASAKVIMGSLWGQTAPTTCHSPTIYADIVLQSGGSHRRHGPHGAGQHVTGDSDLAFSAALARWDWLYRHGRGDSAHAAHRRHAPVPD